MTPNPFIIFNRRIQLIRLNIQQRLWHKFLYCELVVHGLLLWLLRSLTGVVVDWLGGLGRATVWWLAWTSVGSTISWIILMNWTIHNTPISRSGTSIASICDFQCAIEWILIWVVMSWATVHTLLKNWSFDCWLDWEPISSSLIKILFLNCWSMLFKWHILIINSLSFSHFLLLLLLLYANRLRLLRLVHLLLDNLRSLPTFISLVKGISVLFRLWLV